MNVIRFPKCTACDCAAIPTEQSPESQIWLMVPSVSVSARLLDAQNAEQADCVTCELALWRSYRALASRNRARSLLLPKSFRVAQGFGEDLRLHFRHYMVRGPPAAR